MTITTTDTPRIYVACLAAYNNGRLHGRWIDADQDADAIRAEVAEMLAESPEPYAEEWAIHDFEGFGDYRLSESEDFDTVARLAQNIEKHGEPYLAALALACDADDADRLMDEYCGRYDSDAAFAEQLLDDCGEIPKDLPAYIHIDWDRTAADLMMDYVEQDHHYFRRT